MVAPSRRLQKPKFWLASVAVGLVTFHLNLDWRLTSNIDRLSLSVFFWSAFGILLWRKRNSLNLESGVFSSFLGLALIAWTLLRGLATNSPADVLRDISPAISILGLGLLASGIKGLKQYWHELIIVAVLAVPQTHLLIWIDKLVDVSTLVAKFSAFLLWYLGFEVYRQGVNVVLPTGAIEINPPCSGLDTMLILLRLAVLFLVMSSTNWLQKILVPLVAVGLAFTVNGVRITLMAFLVAFSNQAAFEYWHEGDGAQVFSVISILLFGLFYYFIVQQDQAEQGSGEF